MNGRKNKFSHLTQIFNINEDWLTPVEYLILMRYLGTLILIRVQRITQIHNI
jgi:hypothetical protein